MHNALSHSPQTVLGYRKDGRAIFPIAGGDGSQDPSGVTVTISDPPADPAASAPSANAPAAPDKVFTAEDLERVRKEEKDKLYPELKGTREKLQLVEQELAKIAKQREDEEAARKAKADEAEAARKAKAEDEASAKDLLKQRETEWNQRFEELQRERENDRALLEKERQFTQLQNYIQRRVAEEAANESIAPQLLDLVTGNTPEEVEQSIALYQQKSQDIVESVRQAATAARSQQRGVSPTGYATTGPLDNQPGTKTFTAEELKNMSMAEYAKYRQYLPGVGSASQNSNNRGMFV